MARTLKKKKKSKLYFRMTNDNLNNGEENENLAELRYMRWKVKNREQAKDLLRRVNPGEFRFRIGNQDATVADYFKTLNAILLNPMVSRKYNPIEILYKAKPTDEVPWYYYRIDWTNQLTEEEEVRLNRYRLNSDFRGAWELRSLHPIEFFKEEPEIPGRALRFFIQPFENKAFQRLFRNLPYLVSYRRTHEYLTRLSGRRKLQSLQKSMLNKLMTRRRKKRLTALPSNVLSVIEQQIGSRPPIDRPFENPSYLQQLDTTLFEE